jgi:hypothetical protein
VKDLWYDMRLLQSLWPPLLSAFKSESHQLSKFLGDDHDVAELRDLMIHHADQIHIEEVNLKVLLPLMGHYQTQLRQQAWPLGQRLYAESPAVFCDRLQQYWQVAYSA